MSIVTTGWKLPATAANVAATGKAWVNPSNITTEDDTNFATRPDMGGSGYISSDYLRGSNYGFTIPSGATILGIEVRINGGNVDDSPPWYHDSVRVLKALAAVGDDKSTDALLGPSGNNNDYSFGGSSDLWGAAWTPAEINDSGFGAYWQVKENDNTGQTSTVYCDTIAVRVTYRLPPMFLAMGEF